MSWWVLISISLWSAFLISLAPDAWAGLIEASRRFRLTWVGQPFARAFDWYAGWPIWDRLNRA